MAKPVAGLLPPGLVDAYNKGYGRGYNRKPPSLDEIDLRYELNYRTAYIVGWEDRTEDDEAIASGEFDLLHEEERRLIYGDEHDRV